MLIIGSVAMAMNGKSLRAANDLDLIATFDELNQLTRDVRGFPGVQKVLSLPYSRNKTVLKLQTDPDVPYTFPRIIEVEIAWPGSTGAELLALTKEHHSTRSQWWSSLSKVVAGSRAADLNVLLTLKLSHRYLKNSPHFGKTVTDIRMLRHWGAKVFDQGWLTRREKETYTYAHPKLNTTKQDFFKIEDGVRYIFDHDSIHEAMAHIPVDPTKAPLIPAYKLYAGEGEVHSDKAKFFSVSEATRLYGVLEEAQVLALERSQIPYGFSPIPNFSRIRAAHDIKPYSPPEIPPSPWTSFKIALEKVCTSITSGWFREFAWENYIRVLDMYEGDYTDRFWRAVHNGSVFRTPESVAKEEEYERR